MEDKSSITGLTPQQEQAAILLASGNTITATAQELNVDRGTVYRWQGKACFQAFFNKLCSDIQTRSTSGLYGLFDSAIQALKDSLQSDNSAIRLKAALSVLDRVKDVKIGETNPIKMIKAQCTSITLPDDFNWGTHHLNEKRFMQICKEHNLDHLKDVD